MIFDNEYVHERYLSEASISSNIHHPSAKDIIASCSGEKEKVSRKKKAAMRFWVGTMTALALMQ
eukprot:6166799-Ditylum_brightwellii.AAC.1